MSDLFTAPFWVDTARRVIRTFAQALVAVLLGTGISTGSLATIDWSFALQTAALAGLICLLQAVGRETDSVVSAAVEPSPARAKPAHNDGEWESEPTTAAEREAASV